MALKTSSLMKEGGSAILSDAAPVAFKEGEDTGTLTLSRSTTFALEAAAPLPPPLTPPLGPQGRTARRGQRGGVPVPPGGRRPLHCVEALLLLPKQHGLIVAMLVILPSWTTATNDPLSPCSPPLQSSGS